MAVAIIVCQPFVDLIQSILYGSPHFNAVLLNHLRIKYWLSIFPERCSKLYTDDEWLEKAAFWTCLQDKYYDNFTRKLLSARPMEITSCVDVAVLPRDFSHEITWKHCFRNWLRKAYQLVDHLYKSFSASGFSGSNLTSGCRLSVGWPLASSSVRKVRRTAKCFRWSPTWACQIYDTLTMR